MPLGVSRRRLDAGAPLRVQWRGRRVHVRLDAPARSITATLEAGEPMALHVGGRSWPLTAGPAIRAEWSGGVEPTPAHPG